MVQLGLVGFGAGAAAALLFASVTSGSWMSILLFYLAPLPIMIAGLGWSHWAAIIAALSAALAIGATLGGVLFLSFLAAVGIPAWWLSYLALLARPVGPATGNGVGNPALEWYPPGRIVVWAAALGALLVAVALPNFGTDGESFKTAFQVALKRMFEAEANSPLPDNTDRLIAFLVITIPPTAAILATITSVVNLWLAGRVVSFSGLLKRPWPDLSALTFPRAVLAALAAAIALGFAGGIAGILGAVLSSSLLAAYAILGFAVLHTVTRGVSTRPFALGSIYASVLLFGWPALVMSLFGIADSALDLRGRLARRRARRSGPPTLT